MGTSKRQAASIWSAKFFPKAFVLCLMFAQYTSGNGGRSSSKPKAIGGQDAPRGRFPYMCSLSHRDNKAHGCGGTLIKQRWVLTAAHCVDPLGKSTVGLSSLIFCGVLERQERPKDKEFSAERTYVHGSWDGTVDNGFDIALIKLDGKADLDTPDLPSPGHIFSFGDTFAAMGWGLNDSQVPSDKLQIVEQLSYFPLDDCNDRFWDGNITESMICAGSEKQDTAKGDSGGPLLELNRHLGEYELGSPASDLLVGVVSFGHEDKEPFRPGIYTSVSYYIEWIDCVISSKLPQEECNVRKFGPAGTSRPNDTNSSSSENAEESPLPQPSSDRDSSPAPEPSEDIDKFLRNDGREHLYSDSSPISAPAVELDSSPISEPAVEPDSLPVYEPAVEPDSPPSLESLSAPGPSTSPRSSPITPSPSPDDDVEMCIESIPDDDFDEDEALEVKQSQRIQTAIEKDKDSEVRRILCDGLDPNVTFGSVSSSLLTMAARYDAVKSAKVILQYGTNIEYKDDNEDSALTEAAEYGSVSVARLLIKNKADIESLSENDYTPLSSAVVNGQIEIVKLLLRKGASVDTTTDSGFTPLHTAARNDEAQIAQILIDAGAELEAKSNDESSPLDMAANWGSSAVAEVLIEEGADVDATDANRFTPLHSAASRGHVSVVRVLLEGGASKSATNDDGKTPCEIICDSAFLASSCSGTTVATLEDLLEP